MQSNIWFWKIIKDTNEENETYIHTERKKAANRAFKRVRLRFFFFNFRIQSGQFSLIAVKNEVIREVIELQHCAWMGESKQFSYVDVSMCIVLWCAVLAIFWHLTLTFRTQCITAVSNGWNNDSLTISEAILTWRIAGDISTLPTPVILYVEIAHLDTAQSVKLLFNSV